MVRDTRDTRGTRGRKIRVRPEEYGGSGFDSEDYGPVFDSTARSSDVTPEGSPRGYSGYGEMPDELRYKDVEYDEDYNPDDYYTSYGDEGYEDYGEIGSNYDPTSESGWGYDNFDEYNIDRYGGYNDREIPERRPASRDVSAQPSQRRRSVSSEYPSVDDTLGAIRTQDRAASRRAMPSLGRGSNDGEAEYLRYLSDFEQGRISEREMSRIQREFERKPFWQNFRPSRDLISKFGSGNRSSVYPLFRQSRDGWYPILS